MLRSKEIMTAAFALVTALGIGYVMQKSETAHRYYGSSGDPIPLSQMPILDDGGPANEMLDVQEITLTSAEMMTGFTLPVADTQVVTIAAPASVLEEPVVPEAAVEPACDIVADARPVAAAMVNLTLSAPCLPNERITVHHNGMIFTETTSRSGTLDLRVPALAQEAVFILAFANGDGAVAQTTVEELQDYDRVVLQWAGDTGFQIHAREFGADYGTAGHIWDGAPGDILATISGESGVMIRYGDVTAAEPLLAEVYSFPKGFNTRDGSIALSVESEVTEANCGLEVEAQTLEIAPDGQVKTQNLTLAVPDCDAKGSFLVLNNLLADLKVAGM